MPTTDNDFKSMLAHSSIENIGIIVAGVGAGDGFRCQRIIRRLPRSP